MPIINKRKYPKQNKKGREGEETRNKMKGPTSKKTKEPPKRVNLKGNIKFSNSLLSQEAYQKRVNLKGNIKFSNSLLSQEAYQKRVNLKGNIKFSNSLFYRKKHIK